MCRVNVGERDDREDGAGDSRQVRGHGDGGDLIALGVADHLPGADVVGHGPRAVNENGRRADGLVEAEAERLAVDADDLAGGGPGRGGHPTQQAIVEPGRPDRPEYGVEAAGPSLIIAPLPGGLSWMAAGPWCTPVKFSLFL